MCACVCHAAFLVSWLQYVMELTFRLRAPEIMTNEAACNDALKQLGLQLANCEPLHHIYDTYLPKTTKADRERCPTAILNVLMPLFMYSSNHHLVISLSDAQRAWVVKVGVLHVVIGHVAACCNLVSSYTFTAIDTADNAVGACLEPCCKAITVQTSLVHLVRFLHLTSAPCAIPDQVSSEHAETYLQLIWQCRNTEMLLLVPAVFRRDLAASATRGCVPPGQQWPDDQHGLEDCGAYCFNICKTASRGECYDRCRKCRLFMPTHVVTVWLWQHLLLMAIAYFVALITPACLHITRCRCWEVPLSWSRIRPKLSAWTYYMSCTQSPSRYAASHHEFWPLFSAQVAANPLIVAATFAHMLIVSALNSHLTSWHNC